MRSEKDKATNRWLYLYCYAPWKSMNTFACPCSTYRNFASPVKMLRNIKLARLSMCSWLLCCRCRRAIISLIVGSVFPLASVPRAAIHWPASTPCSSDSLRVVAAVSAIAGCLLMRTHSAFAFLSSALLSSVFLSSAHVSCPRSSIRLRPFLVAHLQSSLADIAPSPL